MTSSNAQGALFSLLAFATFSTHDTVVKFLGGAFSPFQVVFFSVLFGFPIVSIMLLRDRTDGNLLPRFPFWTFLRTAAQVVTTISVFYAFATLPLAQTYAILFASPLVITLMAIPILGETVGWRRGCAVVIGLLGVLIVVQPGSTQLNFGHAMALLGAVCGALASVIVRKVGREERNAVLMLYPMVANFLVMGAILPFVYEPMEAVHLGGVFLMAALAFAATLLQIAAYRAADAIIVAPMQYSQIIWAVLFGWIFFEESLTWSTVLGASVIIGSGVYIVLREEKSDTSETPVLDTKSRYAAGVMPRTGSFVRLLRRNRKTG
ncbi:MAG: DMT family transporter [Mangrovicoccus sp.]